MALPGQSLSWAQASRHGRSVSGAGLAGQVPGFTGDSSEKLGTGSSSPAGPASFRRAHIGEPRAKGSPLCHSSVPWGGHGPTASPLVPEPRPCPSRLTGRGCWQTLVATAAVAAFLRVGAVAVASAPLPARPRRPRLRRRALPGFGSFWRSRADARLQHPRPAAVCPRWSPAPLRGPRTPGAHIPVRWQPWSRCRAPGRPRRALTLQRLQACDAAAQRAALLRSQAVPVLQAGEGAGVEEPLWGRCRAGAGFLCKAKRGRAEAAPAASRSRDGNLPRLGSLPAPPDPSACPIPRDCQQRTESCSVAVGMGPGMRAEVCRWPHRGAVPSAGGVQRSRHSRGQHLCQPGQLESLAQRGGSRRKQRVKSRGHLPGLCGCPAAGRRPQGSAGRQSSSPSIPRRVGHESHLWGTGDRRGEHRLRGAGS